MKIIIAGERFLKDTLHNANLATEHQIIYTEDLANFRNHPEADVFVDFNFNRQFFSPMNKPLLIAETTKTFSEMHGHPLNTARFCNWAGFTERPLWEIAVTGNTDWIEKLMPVFDKKFEIVKDQPGLVAPRILSMIINEACFTLSEGISTIEEIDTAMQLGTNYPDGPFAWAKSIGTGKVYDLLEQLAKTNDLYTPHPMLQGNFA